MTVQIAPEAVMILTIGCLVGLAVCRHTSRPHSGTPTRGDLVGAIETAVGASPSWPSSLECEVLARQHTAPTT